MQIKATYNDVDNIPITKNKGQLKRKLLLFEALYIPSVVMFTLIDIAEINSLEFLLT